METIKSIEIFLKQKVWENIIYARMSQILSHILLLGLTKKSHGFFPCFLGN